MEELHLMAMQTTMPNTRTDVTTPKTVGTARIPECLRLPRVAAGFTLVIGLVFCWLIHRPLWHTDVWGHLAYGRVIVQNGALPATEPLMPLSAGLPFVDTAWLSQVVGYAAVESLGIPAIQFLYAASIAACLSLLVWRWYRQTGNAFLCLTGGALFLWINWQQLSIARPQLAGLLCFVLLLVLLLEGNWRRSYWITIPVLFAVWANLHGSFPLGLALLGCLCAGRFVDCLLQTKRFSSAMRDLPFRRYLLMGLLCTTAVLVNPYGFKLYREVFSVASHPNLAVLVEWGPLHPGMKQGFAAIVVAVVLLMLYWFSPRRISSVEVLLLVGLGAGCLWASRMLIWWAPVAAYYFVMHADVLWKQGRRTAEGFPKKPNNGIWTVTTAALVWVFFSASPLGISLLYGPREEYVAGNDISKFTPDGVARFLSDYAPPGLVFSTYEWGDYLLWRCPGDVEVFVASHAHLIPPEVWRDYLSINAASSDWSELLDRYRVNSVAINYAGHGALIDLLYRHDEWQIVYEDELGAVFLRRVPFDR